MYVNAQRKRVLQQGDLTLEDQRFLSELIMHKVTQVTYLLLGCFEH